VERRGPRNLSEGELYGFVEKPKRLTLPGVKQKLCAKRQYRDVPGAMVCS
jgi:hypothetical protein